MALMTWTGPDCSVSSTDLALLVIDRRGRAHATEVLKGLYWLMQQSDELRPPGGDVGGVGGGGVDAIDGKMPIKMLLHFLFLAARKNTT